jgi:hypothetical protein
LNRLKDVFHKIDEEESQVKVKTITGWIEALPISNVPYVEMGFNTLATDLISKLDKQFDMVKDNYQGITLQCKNSEYLKIDNVF